VLTTSPLAGDGIGTIDDNNRFARLIYSGIALVGIRIPVVPPWGGMVVKVNRPETTGRESRIVSASHCSPSTPAIQSTRRILAGSLVAESGEARKSSIWSRRSAISSARVLRLTSA